jgi:hypothetical protein
MAAPAEALTLVPITDLSDDELAHAEKRLSSVVRLVPELRQSLAARKLGRVLGKYSAISTSPEPSQTMRRAQEMMEAGKRMTYLVRKTFSREMLPDTQLYIGEAEIVRGAELYRRRELRLPLGRYALPLHARLCDDLRLGSYVSAWTNPRHDNDPLGDDLRFVYSQLAEPHHGHFQNWTVEAVMPDGASQKAGYETGAYDMGTILLRAGFQLDQEAGRYFACASDRTPLDGSGTGSTVTNVYIAAPNR